MNEPRGRGRPPLPEGQRRRQISVWISPEEEAEIDRAAAWVDQDRGVYIRESALRRAKRSNGRRKHE